MLKSSTTRLVEVGTLGSDMNLLPTRAVEMWKVTLSCFPEVTGTLESGCVHAWLLLGPSPLPVHRGAEVA